MNGLELPMLAAGTLETLVGLFQPEVLIPWLLGMVFGIFVGATPGLTATMAVALVVPFTFYLPNPNAGLALILGISFTAIFAGDIPAVLLRIPGTPASAAAVIDGYALAKQGRGSFALSLDLWCSALGGLIGTVLLIVAAPQLAQFALGFSNYEYFWLGVLGLGLGAMVSRAPLLRALITTGFGLLLSTIGIDRVEGIPRFTFGRPELASGLDFIAVMVGVFGLAEVLRNVGEYNSIRMAGLVDKSEQGVLNVWTEMWRHRWVVFRSAILGTTIGALPGAGADIAAWAAYGAAQRTSKKPEAFGTGSIEGIVAPTTANNAAISGAWIPALVFGIPGDSITAIALGALLMYNIKPGPLVFQQSGPEMQSIFLIALLTQFFLLPAGWLGIKGFSWIVRLPRSFVLTAVTVFCVVGSYALRNSLFDVWVMVGAGLLGWLLEARRFPVAPLILGLILGPMVEENLRTGLIKSSGNLLPFIVRPLCLFFLGLFALGIAGPKLFRRFRPQKPSTP